MSNEDARLHGHGGGVEELNLHDNPDAQAWAKEFCEMYSVYTADGVVQDKEGLMISWFANAMMAMHDHLHRLASNPEPEDAPCCPNCEAQYKELLERREAEIAALRSQAGQGRGPLTADDVHGAWCAAEGALDGMAVHLNALLALRDAVDAAIAAQEPRDL